MSTANAHSRTSYLRTPIPGECIHIYRNLNKACWSIRSKGKVIAHVDAIQLLNCTCHVSEKGRQAVLATRCRSVHAYVKGTIAASALPHPADSVATLVYRPFVSGQFFDPITNIPIHSSAQMVFSDTGKVYCHGSIA
jgi:hypothetical protein